MSDGQAERAARAAALRAEALGLLDETRLLEVIRTSIGPAEVVGSVALDLMVWPDIDIYTRLASDEAPQLLGLLPSLHAGFERRGWAMVKASFNDEYRRPGNPYGEGLYCGLRLLPPDRRRVWKVDLWGWAGSRFEENVAGHHALARELARADRDLVLRIKEAVHLRPEYRDTLTSMDVYDFALAGQGATVHDFDAFIAARRSSRS